MEIISSTGRASASDEGTFPVSQSSEDSELASLADFEPRVSPINADLGATSSAIYANGGSGAVHSTLPEYVVTPPIKPRKSESFTAIIKWRGTVLKPNGSTFLAKLSPVLGDSELVQAEINVEDIPAEDRNLISRGATFYWSIGYLQKISGTRIKASIIRFRRAAEWSDRDLNWTEGTLKKIKQLLNVE